MDKDTFSDGTLFSRLSRFSDDEFVVAWTMTRDQANDLYASEVGPLGI